MGALAGSLEPRFLQNAVEGFGFTAGGVEMRREADIALP